VRLQIHRPQVGRAAFARADEHQLPAIGRERRLIIVGRTVGEVAPGRVRRPSLGRDPRSHDARR
jgi:hypothetical protein